MWMNSCKPDKDVKHSVINLPESSTILMLTWECHHFYAHLRVPPFWCPRTGSRTIPPTGRWRWRVVTRPPRCWHTRLSSADRPSFGSASCHSTEWTVHSVSCLKLKHLLDHNVLSSLSFFGPRLCFNVSTTERTLGNSLARFHAKMKPVERKIPIHLGSKGQCSRVQIELCQHFGSETITNNTLSSFQHTIFISNI